MIRIRGIGKCHQTFYNFSGEVYGTSNEFRRDFYHVDSFFKLTYVRT